MLRKSCQPGTLVRSALYAKPLPIERLSSKVHKRLACCLVLVCFGSGAINWAGLMGTSTATYIIDGLAVMMGAHLLFSLVAGRATRLATRVWVGWIVLGSAILLLVLAHGTSPIDVLPQARTMLLYPVVAYYIASFVDVEGARAVLRTVIYSGAVVALLGILQVLVGRALPEWLLHSPDAEVFGYFTSSLTRANGLIGNSIVFASALLLIFCILLFDDIGLTGRTRFVLSTLVALGIFASFSRVAIVAAVSVALLCFGRSAKRLIGSASIAISAILIIFGVVAPGAIEWAASSFLFQGIFGGQDAAVAASTDLHDQFAALALDAFIRSPIWGSGLATQVQTESTVAGEIITDGTFLVLIAEGGIMLLAAFLVLWWSWLSLSMARRRAFLLPWWSSGVLIFFVLQLFGLGWVNSGMFGKVAYLTLWVAVGASVVNATRPSSRYGSSEV